MGDVKESGLNTAEHINSRDQYCGAARDGFKPTKCKKCIELKKKTKSCLTCERKFIPGCGAQFICKYCMYRGA
jgi:hypothetical protein